MKSTWSPQLPRRRATCVLEDVGVGRERPRRRKCPGTGGCGPEGRAVRVPLGEQGDCPRPSALWISGDGAGD